ncbi:MAG: putative glycosyl transferase, partial [Clostridia bacterium]|nr:putative glycosyl transferase [Clostridia bacterium]
MITFFTTTKPFKETIATLQENAIESWTRLQPRPQIILFGNDYGAEEITKRFDIV